MSKATHFDALGAPTGLLDALLDDLAERLADKLAQRVGAGAPRYADKDANPYGSARPFLDAARRGEFPSFRRPRKVTALWADVERAIEGSKRSRRAQRPDPADDDRALLEANGIKLHPRTTNDRKPK